MQSRISGGGHSVAAARLDAKLNSAGWVSEQMGGLRYSLNFKFSLIVEAAERSTVFVASCVYIDLSF